MDVREAVIQLGGVARTAELAEVTTKRQRAKAMAAGTVIRLRKGVWGLPELDQARAAAQRLSGTLSHLSAAQHWQWGIRTPPGRPQIIVPRGRKVPRARRKGVEMRWASLPRGDVCGLATTRVRTVIDCARTLPLQDALPVVDSALRSGEVGKTELLLAAGRSPRTGRSRAMEIVELGDARAANAFESVVRAVLLPLEMDFVPQVWIGERRPDLVDVGRRLIVEADSFEFHAGPGSFAHDLERYNDFVTDGWTVIRVGWTHAMYQPDLVRTWVRAASRAQRPSVQRCLHCGAA